MDAARALCDEPKAKKRKKSSDYDEPKVKRGKESSSEVHYYERQKLPPRNVCIICSCLPNYSNDRFHIFIFDLNSGGDIHADGFIPRAPTLRLGLGCFDAFAVCVLGSMLYMFESSDQKNTTNPAQARKLVYTFDLSKLHLPTTFNLKLEKHMLVKAPDMLSANSSPIATATPDGKILVFSSLLQFDPEAKTADNIVEFELYDPGQRSWQKLPGLCDSLGDQKPPSIAFSVKSFTFLGISVFLLQTDNVGMFTLNLQSPDDGWQRLDCYAGARCIPFCDGRFFVIGDGELCVTLRGVYDIKNEDGFSRLFYTPPSSFGAADCKRVSLAVTRLGGGDVDNESISFCQIQTGIGNCTMHPHLIMNVYNCYLNKYRQDKEAMGDSAFLSTSMDKSFKFSLDTQQCVMFRPHYACSI